MARRGADLLRGADLKEIFNAVSLDRVQQRLVEHISVLSLSRVQQRCMGQNTMFFSLKQSSSACGGGLLYDFESEDEEFLEGHEEEATSRFCPGFLPRRVCHNVIIGRVCPCGTQCTFAHCELELHPDAWSG